MVEEKIEGLKELRKKRPEQFLKKLQEFKEEEKPVYEKAIEGFFKEEESQSPIDLMRADIKAGPLDIKVEQAEVPSFKEEKGFNWMLLIVIFGFFLLMLLFVILFLFG